MICQFCGREMKIGTLDTAPYSGNIQWYPETEKDYFNKASNSVTIRSITKFEFPVAYLCFHCHKLIMDIPEKSKFLN